MVSEDLGQIDDWHHIRVASIDWYCTEVLQRKRHQTVVKFTGFPAHLEGQGDLVSR